MAIYRTSNIKIRYAFSEAPLATGRAPVYYSFNQAAEPTEADSGFKAIYTQQILNNLPPWMDARKTENSTASQLVNSWAMSLDFTRHALDNFELATDLTQGLHYNQAIAYKYALTPAQIEALTPRQTNYLVNSALTANYTYFPGWECNGATQGRLRPNGTYLVNLPAADEFGNAGNCFLKQQVDLAAQNFPAHLWASIDVKGEGSLECYCRQKTGAAATFKTAFNNTDWTRVNLEVSSGPLAALDFMVRGVLDFAAPMLSPDCKTYYAGTPGAILGLTWLPTKPLTAIIDDELVLLNSISWPLIKGSWLPTRAGTPSETKPTGFPALFPAHDEWLTKEFWQLTVPPEEVELFLINADSSNTLIRTSPVMAVRGVAIHREMLGWIVGVPGGALWLLISKFRPHTANIFQALIAIDLSSSDEGPVSFACFSTDLRQIQIRFQNSALLIKDLYYDYYSSFAYSIATIERYDKVII